MTSGSEVQVRELAPVISSVLGEPVSSMQTVGNGGNSRTFRVEGTVTGRCFAKFYFQSRHDRRERLQTEFTALRFLSDHGIKRVPRPIVADYDHGLGIYEFIDGDAFDVQILGSSDIDDAVDFLADLSRLTRSEGSRDLPAASEACFSIAAAVENIKLRFDRLNDLNNASGLSDFLKRDFRPALTQIEEWCRKSAAESGIDFAKEISHDERTLSPSDFGFHNALKKQTGEIFFLDFEYFGWDDPAKMVCDFLWHPAMKLSPSLKQRFVNWNLVRLEYDKALSQRIRITYPIYGLKWCMIFLNEFVHEDFQRREFANGLANHKDRILERQLEKANAMLQRVLQEHERFPYMN